MSFNADRAFEADGLIIGEASGIFSGAASPLGNQAPTGSIYLQSDSMKWIKYSAGVDDWLPADDLFESKDFTVDLKIPDDYLLRLYKPCFSGLIEVHGILEVI